MQIDEVWKQIEQEVPFYTIVDHDVDTRKAFMSTTRKFLQMIERSEILDTQEVKTLKRIRKKINDSWINYLYGRVNTASSQMQNLLQLHLKEQSYHELFRLNQELPTTLYRGRISKEPFADVSEFYHIPFTKRYLIGNQRFSLSGIPCLYLASSKACVYAELGTKHQVQLCQMTSKDTITMFDMSMEVNFPTTREAQVNALYRMPLKYACSILALDNDGATFKTNYIIPQLVTATLYNMNTDYEGIRYSSIRGRTLKHLDKLNYVFLPTYRLDSAMYDVDLLSKFMITILK